MLDMNIDPRYEDLLDAVRPYTSVVVAYSGGVDSTLVVKACVDALGLKSVVAALGVSASLAPRERVAAKATLDAVGLESTLREVETGEQSKEEYRVNNSDRCFHCKTDLYSHLREVQKREGMLTLANGANQDDLGDFRPGMDAARNDGVKSPLIEAAFTKDDVRRVARSVGLPNWDKPAAPCLASRVPHGTEVTPEVLYRIAQAEAYLQDLGLSGFRVRHHDDLARIELAGDRWDELDNPEVRQQIEEAFKTFGYRFVALDLGGYRQGKAVIR
jgi:uncharacterized protein